MSLFNWLNNKTKLSKEDVANITNLAIIKEIYSCWDSNDDGEDFTLYTGLAVDGVTPRFFLRHFKRDWYGGWSYDETTTWYEVSEQDYLHLFTSLEKNQE